MSSSTSWPEGAVEFVQAIADTKLLLSQRYAEWMLSGPALEDDIAGANAAQDELGHVRQLFRLLEEQGQDSDWLEGERAPEEYANASTLDEQADDWVTYVVRTATTDWAAWVLLDAIDHDDFDGLIQKMGEDEYFHVQHHDGRLESLAERDPEQLQAALEAAVPDVLTFIGPADAASDSLLTGEFTDRSVAELRDAFLDHYEELFEGTDVSLAGVDRETPPADEWDGARRRVNDGAISSALVDSLRGVRNQEYAVQ